MDVMRGTERSEASETAQFGWSNEVNSEAIPRVREEQ